MTKPSRSFDSKSRSHPVQPIHVTIDKAWISYKVVPVSSEDVECKPWIGDIPAAKGNLRLLSYTDLRLSLLTVSPQDLVAKRVQMSSKVLRGPGAYLPLNLHCAIRGEAVVAGIREAWAIGEMPRCDICEVLIRPDLTSQKELRRAENCSRLNNHIKPNVNCSTSMAEQNTQFH